MVTYVDGVMVMAESAFGAKWVKAVRHQWDTSTPEWLPSMFEKEVDEEAVKKITGGEKVEEITFCGLQLRWYDEGLKVHQEKYIQSVLRKNGIENCKPATTIPYRQTNFTRKKMKKTHQRKL